MTTLRLHPASDADFAWLLAPDTAHPDQLTLPPGAFETASILRRLRVIALNMRTHHPPGAWLMVRGREIIG
ncbi:hypothetical protein [Elstera litoralis]|uniref:hypothetical protein n=1 Tax=Elstera litoralis TaxID=552518 RepID=UPI00069730FD|nr:hypothetical protein [Elstera litoralis]